MNGDDGNFVVLNEKIALIFKQRGEEDGVAPPRAAAAHAPAHPLA